MTWKYLLPGLLLLVSVSSNGQETENYEASEIDLSSSQVAGYSAIGLGATTLVYTYSDASDNFPSVANHRTAYYIAGSALVLTGVAFLIFGDKEEGKPKYWKGMKKDNSMNMFEPCVTGTNPFIYFASTKNSYEKISAVSFYHYSVH